MIRHIAFFRFKDGTTGDDIARLDEGLGTLPGIVEAIKGYSFGRDLALIEGTWDYAVVADFADVDGFLEYSAHPAHVEALSTRIKPLIAESARVQFTIHDGIS